MEQEFSESGIFLERNEEGKYTIAINSNNLENPTALIATIAHELSHVKLLGENRIEDNDEELTDLTTIIFGFGIFNANASFQFNQSFDRWGYNSLGYLKIEEWAYALALHAYIREEINPEWANQLDLKIKPDFDNYLKYMYDNEDEIFKFE